MDAASARMSPCCDGSSESERHYGNHSDSGSNKDGGVTVAARTVGATAEAAKAVTHMGGHHASGGGVRGSGAMAAT